MNDSHLFDVDAYVTTCAETNNVGSHALGKMAEMLLVVELLKRGHKIALPLVDDDGVDVVVNYRKAVQVKSVGRPLPGQAFHFLTLRKMNVGNGERRKMALAEHVDVLAVYAHDACAWWHIPAAEITGRKNLTLGPKQAQWRDAWHVYDVAA